MTNEEQIIRFIEKLGEFLDHKPDCERDGQWYESCTCGHHQLTELIAFPKLPTDGSSTPDDL